jgi:hypothetical protein
VDNTFQATAARWLKIFYTFVTSNIKCRQIIPHLKTMKDDRISKTVTKIQSKEQRETCEGQELVGIGRLKCTSHRNKHLF